MGYQSAKDRAEARVNAYFHNRDQELLRKLAEAEARKRRRDELANQTGIQDEELLDRMLDWQIEPEALEALFFVPLVEIAWASGRVDETQRKAVLAAARQKGIQEDSLADQKLRNWLTARPPAGLLDAWKHYVNVLAQRMSRNKLQALRDDIMDRALFVAEAAGGILGFYRVSREENAKLDELARMLNEFTAAFSAEEPA
jgi:hypothetical protein